MDRSDQDQCVDPVRIEERPGCGRMAAHGVTSDDQWPPVRDRPDHGVQVLYLTGIAVPLFPRCRIGCAVAPRIEQVQAESRSREMSRSVNHVTTGRAQAVAEDYIHPLPLRCPPKRQVRPLNLEFPCFGIQGYFTLERLALWMTTFSVARSSGPPRRPISETTSKPETTLPTTA